MNKFTHLLRFVQYLFDDRDLARKGKEIIEGILKVHSPRLSDIVREMSGKEKVNYIRVSKVFWRATYHSKRYYDCSRKMSLL